MDVACFVGPAPGHLDFGGSGFLRLALALRDRGHTVRWFSAQRHCERLLSEGFSVNSDGAVPLLRISPLFSLDDIEADIDAYQARITALADLYGALCENPPDLMLMDRILAIGQLVADQLGVPSAVVGTNGGYWKRDGREAVVSSSPIAAYQEVGERIKQDLNWSKGSLESFWARSPQANISFLGKSYYQETGSACGSGLFVHHFDSPAAVDRRGCGVSYGNSGDPALMSRLLAGLRSSSSIAGPREIFTGNRQQIFQELCAEERADENIHGWTDFSDYLPGLRFLALFGGIGTVWHCINNNLPMLVIPGGIGDQQFNAKRVSEMGLGERLPPASVDDASLETLLGKLVSDDRYVRNIAHFKDMKNYTDTLATAVDKLEALP